MADLASALDILVPAALYRGSLTDNTQDAYEALIWDDARPKPLYADVLDTAEDEVAKKALKEIAAAIRWARIAGGFTYHGNKYDTDFQSPNAFVTAYAIASANPNYSTKWKLFDGTFIQLTATDIKSLVEAFNNFSDACFAAEANCVTGIDNGTITTEGQIAAIINAIPNSL